MKRWIILLVLNGVPACGTTQNLIPNASFESELDFTKLNKTNWYKVQNDDTPDYFNFSSLSSNKSIFDIYQGGTYPKHGDSFIGIFCFRKYPEKKVSNIREYIESPLQQTLERDSIYRIELSICLDKESNVALRNIGVLFVENAMEYVSQVKLFNSHPQVEFTLNYGDNMYEWIVVSSFFKASGNEKNIIIGNFRSDRLTILEKIMPIEEKGKKSKWNLADSEKAAYYFFDDLNLEKVRFMTKADQGSPLSDAHSDSLVISKIKIDSAVVLHNVYFDFDKADLLADSYPELDKLRQLLDKHPSFTIKIEGHTDNSGSYAYNLRLSFLRAESVARYLISSGISASRIEYAGYGYVNPIASNDTDEGRKENRRVVFKITNK